MSQQLKCIIIDDEQGAIDVLSGYVQKVSWLDLDNDFTDPLEALNYLSQSPVDLVFMDINMPDLNGMQLARLVRSENTDIIFCTAYPEHAVESYEVQALDYLLKPIPFERFLAAVNKAQAQLGSNESITEAPVRHQEHIFIKSGSQIHQVETRKINFIQKDGHYIVFKIDGKELLSRMTFSQLMELLPQNEFIQVHRSYVVAVNKIEIIQKQFIKIEGKEIPLGDAFKEAFFKRVNFIGN